MSEDKPTRKSTVRKQIKRTYNVDQYESLDVLVEGEIEIEWSNSEELLKKAANFTKVVLIDFNNTKEKVFEELDKVEDKTYYKLNTGSDDNDENHVS